MIPSISPFLSFSDIPEKASNLPRVSVGFINKNKTHWSCICPFPDKPKAGGQGGSDNSQGDEEKPEWTRVEAREDQRESAA